jgi:hypothetical protein
MSMHRLFTWIATLSLFLLLAALLTKCALWLVYGGHYYRSQLTVMIAASFGCLLSALVMLYAPHLLRRVPPLLRKLTPRTRMSKLGVIAVAVLILCFVIVLWPRPVIFTDSTTNPDLVKEFERNQQKKPQPTPTPITLDPSEVEDAPAAAPQVKWDDPPPPPPGSTLEKEQNNRQKKPKL